MFIPDYPFIEIPYIGRVNQKAKENMNEFYYFVIRYYRTTKSGRKQYMRMQSPYYHLSTFCELEMRDQIFALSKDYSMDSYSIQSVFLNPDEVINGDIEIREF